MLGHTNLDHLTDSAAHGALMLFFPTDDTDWLRFASHGASLLLGSLCENGVKSYKIYPKFYKLKFQKSVRCVRSV